MSRHHTRRSRCRSLSPSQSLTEAQLAALRDELWARAVEHETILAVKRGDACAAPCLQPPRTANPDRPTGA